MGERRSTAKGTCGRWGAGANAVVAVMALTLAGPAAAQDPLAVQSPLAVQDPLMAQASAAGQQAIAFDIAEQDLNAALLLFADRTGLQLVYDIGLVEDLRNAPLNGSFTPQEALTRLLAGTGIAFRVGGDDTVTLERSFAEAGDGPLLLAPISVPGFVAEEGRAGLFGDRRIEDIPFSVTAYTEEVIQRQQAQTIRDALENDPSVRFNLPRAIGDQFTIRGFPVFNSEVATEGLFGVSPQASTLLEPYSRVEVFRGPNALLNGVPPFGNIGGVINLMPKRATETALTDLNLRFESDGNVGGHLDVGRRFGEGGDFGARLNGIFRSGDLAVDNASSESALASLALDYNGDRLRITTDLLYQDRTFDVPQSTFQVAGNDFSIPDAPDARTNSAQLFSSSDTETIRAIVGVEYDVFDNWTLQARYGRLRETEGNDAVSVLSIQNADGDVDGNFIDRTVTYRNQVFEGGINGFFRTGSVEHEFAVQASLLDRELDIAQFFGLPPGVSLAGGTLNNPVRIAEPDFPTLPAEQRLIESTFASVAVSDTLSVFDGRVQLTAGLRLQDLEQTVFNLATGDPLSSYDESELSPSVGLVLKPIEGLSLYGSYTEGLTPGPVAPGTASNSGEVFAPFVSEQIEIGAKWSGRGFGASLALFRITQPQGFVEPASNLFVVDGEVRNRGLEALVYGDVTDDARLLGGILLQDGEQVSTAGGVDDGNDAIGIPNVQLNLYGEYDLPFLSGITANGRVVYTSKQFVDSGNRQSIPSWVRFDVGASYDFAVKGVPTTLNLDILNVADKDYWQSSARGFLSTGAPRTFLLTTSFRF